MADSNQLTTWLLENASHLNLQVDEFSWVREWNLAGYSDIQVTIEIDGRKFVGRGTAIGEDLAFIKAGAEAIERAYCAGHHIHSTGVALHTVEETAKENVHNEMNERDAFFCHFYTKTPFLPVADHHYVELMRAFKGAFDQILPLGIKIRLFRARWIGWPVFLCVASGLLASPPWGGIIGLGSQSNEWRAIQIAFFECMRSVALAVSNGPWASLTLEEFERILRPTSVDRKRLALNGKYWKEISDLFPEKSGGAESLRQAPHRTGAWPWILERLECPFDVLKSAPVFVYRAKLCEKPGDVLFRGHDRSPTTLRRLSEFLNSPLGRDQLELRPHFLG